MSVSICVSLSVMLFAKSQMSVAPIFVWHLAICTGLIGIAKSLNAHCE